MTPDEVYPGFIGLALKRRGKDKHHVQIFKCYFKDGDVKIRHVGGNENHRVKSKVWEPADFFSDCLMVVTYE